MKLGVWRRNAIPICAGDKPRSVEAVAVEVEDADPVAEADQRAVGEADARPA